MTTQPRLTAMLSRSQVACRAVQAIDAAVNDRKLKLLVRSLRSGSIGSISR